MRVFVTGGTGYVGSAVVRALVEAGHEVTSLARSAAKEAALSRLGARAIRGDLSDPAGIARAARGSDGFVHAAMDYGLGPPADRAALEALLEAARQGEGPRVLVYTSGVWVLGDTGPEGADESTAITHPAAAVAWRPAHEQLALGAAAGGLVTAVIRPGMVYGGKGGLLAPFFETAVKDGAAAFVGEGRNRWSLVHREDLARLYLRVLESRASGVYHGVDGEAPTLADLARAASQAAGKEGAVRPVPLEEARRGMGPMADALALDQVVRGEASQRLGWRPAWSGFLARARDAFREWAA
ncbi:NAD-dependent epimerase/dehydratase family protein [Anaeromyxobacter paludicola]|uniref:NAD-dependent epimerase n=1 Tax=Anaeromyxobacter paludicola TaxID=2918171 RepID=A0ABM7XF06_9BACT|nr:NAD-dependent epimerase/dehydratase family protein [Anaeromyxobacter paludicola]BDG10484.1 NAD-dependent epimerase [Anaeromyxobacter paludicola]